MIRASKQISRSKKRAPSPAHLTEGERKAFFEHASRYARDTILLIARDGRILECNEAAAAAYGYAREELLRLDVYALRAAEARAFLERDTKQASRDEGQTFETVHVRKDGSAFPVEVSSHAITVGKRSFLVSSIRNITERKRDQARLEELALRDALTGLANRRLLDERVSQAIGYARRNKNAMAVLYLDLDGFKQVNDVLGHDAGDELLKVAAERLVSTVRAIDTVARVGGDEFVIALWPLQNAEHVHIVARKIVATVARPFTIKQQTVNVTTSVGVSLFPDHGNDVASLLNVADQSLYQAKRDGKNTYRVADLAVPR